MIKCVSCKNISLRPPANADELDSIKKLSEERFGSTGNPYEKMIFLICQSCGFVDYIFDVISNQDVIKELR